MVFFLYNQYNMRILQCYLIRTKKKLNIMSKKKNIIKTEKLDKRNEIVMIKEDDFYRVISLRKPKWIGWLIGWRSSEFSLDYQTDLKGKKIVDGRYIGFENKELADKWMDFQVSRFNKRFKFIGA